MVPPAGFEPAISTLKGWRPGPLDDGGLKSILGHAAGRGKRPSLVFVLGGLFRWSDHGALIEHPDVNGLDRPGLVLTAPDDGACA